MQQNIIFAIIYDYNWMNEEQALFEQWLQELEFHNIKRPSIISHNNDLQ